MRMRTGRAAGHLLVLMLVITACTSADGTVVHTSEAPETGGSPSGMRNAVYQLQGYRHEKLNALARGDYQLAIIDLARDAGSDYFTRDEITRLKESGKKVLAYIEIGSIGDYRPEYPSFVRDNPELVLNEWSEWPGEYFVKYWDLRWWNQVVKPRVDRAIKAGFDGVYMDTPLAYEEIDLRLVPGESRRSLARKMVDLIVKISQYAKSAEPGFWVFPQNSPELKKYRGYASAIDGFGIEELFFRATDKPCDQDWCTKNLDNVRALRDLGKIVVAVDYATKPQNVAYACRRYREEHFVGYVADVNLDNIRPPCP